MIDTPRYLIDADMAKLPRTHTKTLVIGSGIAGLFSAIKAAEHGPVLLITKKPLGDSNTAHAQGGVAAVMAPGDSPEFHLRDTLRAGAGLCSQLSVRVLVQEGPKAVQELMRLGTHFDEEDGKLALTREGAHSHRRILHANGDATGAEIVRALSEQIKQHDAIKLWEEHFVIDLLTEGGECGGAIVQDSNGQLMFVKADATILCSGGAGQMYRDTTNPVLATGDGLAIAYRAGAVLRDMEFVQFHPTALKYPRAPRFLISEAVRGEGAVLRNSNGERFMSYYHEFEELAPRDVVARAIVGEMEQTHADYVYLDITHQPEDLVKQRFPTIYKFCLQYGLDLTVDWIPVAPAAHYMMGGVKTNLYGETNIKRLYACGEVSSTGVHGANRLASNSLCEALVFGSRIAERIKRLEPLERDVFPETNDLRTAALDQVPIETRRLKLQSMMLNHVGVKRSAASLERAYKELSKETGIFRCRLTKIEQYEYANLLTCSLLVIKAAHTREESRGGHFREEFPDRDDRHWLKHLLLQRDSGMMEEMIASEL